MLMTWIVFVPSRGFLFFYEHKQKYKEVLQDCFRPLTGISLFLLRWNLMECMTEHSFRPLTGISLFLFSCHNSLTHEPPVFVPSRGFLFFYKTWEDLLGVKVNSVFVPSRGFLFFYYYRLALLIILGILVFVPSRGFLFFYPISYSPYKSRAIFIICGANIFKPSECYF